MAMFGVDGNIMGEMFKSAMRKDSFEGQQENSFATALMSNKVSAVGDTGLKVYLETTEFVAKALALPVPSMTPENAAFALECAKEMMVAKKGYVVNFFGIT